MPDLDMTWLDDEDFCWRAAGELLTALGCSPSTVRGLAGVRASVPSLEDHPAAELDVIGRSVLPAAREALDRLAAEGIRPEVLGVDSDLARLALAELQDAYEEGSWRTLSEDELDARMDQLMAPYLGGKDGSAATLSVLMAPVAPEHGEVGRIVDVLRRMPKETVVRVAKVWNRLALRGVVAGALLALRRSGGLSHPMARGAAGAPASTGPGTMPSAAAAPVPPVTSEDVDELRRRNDDQIIAIAEQWPEGFLMPRMKDDVRAALGAAVQRRVAAGGSVSPAVLNHVPEETVAALTAQRVTTVDGAWAGERSQGDAEARARGYGDWSGVTG